MYQNASAPELDQEDCGHVQILRLSTGTVTVGVFENH